MPTPAQGPDILLQQAHRAPVSSPIVRPLRPRECGERPKRGRGGTAATVGHQGHREPGSAHLLTDDGRGCVPSAPRATVWPRTRSERSQQRPRGRERGPCPLATVWPAEGDGELLQTPSARVEELRSEAPCEDSMVMAAMPVAAGTLDGAAPDRRHGRWLAGVIEDSWTSLSTAWRLPRSPMPMCP